MIWWFALVGTPDHFSSPPPLYNCYEYDFVEDDTVFSRTNELCYISPLIISQKRYILTVETDSLTMRFAVLKKFSLPNNKNENTGSQSFAVVVGQPDQLYVIREEVRVADNRQTRIRSYVFSLRPINQYGRLKRRIEGHVLEVSTQQICAL